MRAHTHNAHTHTHTGAPHTYTKNSVPAGLDAPDVRAALILRLLLQNAANGAVPSLTHALMGYDVEPSMSGLEESLLLPRVDYSCLTIFERALLYQGCM